MSEADGQIKIHFLRASVVRLVIQFNTCEHVRRDTVANTLN